MSSASGLFFAGLVCIWWTVVHSSTKDHFDLSSKGSQRNGELIFVHVLYRHGDRNPTQENPGDKYDISYWKEGWGELTTLGKQQQFALGQWLRCRYKNFLSNKFNVSDIYVQSSDVDRTLMSAEANLAGLYPPYGNQIWNYKLLWQPIPVHSIPASTDFIIAGNLPSCPAYENAYNEYMSSYEMKKFEKHVQPFYDYLTAKTGVIINTPIDLTLFRDSWLVETTHKLTIPKWAKSLYVNNRKFYKAALASYTFASATTLLAKFRSGYLLKDVLDRFSSKARKTLSPDRKFWMYSTHDSILFSFLQSLDISDNDFVPYAAAVILELTKYNNEFYVQIFYKNSDKSPDPIYIPRCGRTCRLSEMYEIYDNILPKNEFDIECQTDE